MEQHSENVTTLQGRKKAAAQTFVLPWPPSANRLWRSVRTGGRNAVILSGAYRAWRDFAGKVLIVQRPKRISGPVRIGILLSPPTRRLYDLDNRVKPLLDLLVNCQVITADDTAIVREITVTSGSGFKGARVTVSPMGDA